MADCEFLGGCPFFHDQMQNMPAAAELYKRRLCRGAFTECARFYVAKNLGRGTPPPDLFPSDIERAKKLVAAKS